MSQLDTLLSRMQQPSDVRMRADGYALWLKWSGELNPVVSQFMQEYGGLTLEMEEDQALLFFFSANAFLAAARLESWSRLDATTLTITIMPGTLIMGDSRSFFLEVDSALRHQDIAAPSSFTVWLHPDVIPAATATPGISASEQIPPSGLAAVAWKQLSVDLRMPFQMSLGWYAILRPLGNPIDKEFQNGWRNLFDEIEKILQRNKFRYTINDFFLMFPLENPRLLRSWVHSYLSLIGRLKKEEPDKYWPCVLAVTDKKGMSFNNDLPKKVGLDWDMLAADHPYMSFRNALALGSEFAVHEVRFAAGNGSDDWCNVSLVNAEGEGGYSLPMLTPGSLALGDNPVCFYCGQRSHVLTECPSRILPARDKDIWRRVAGFAFATMKEGVRTLDEAVKRDGLEAIPTILAQDTSAAVMGRALYDIDYIFQLRSLPLLWRARGKTVPTSTDLLEMDNNPVWDILSSYTGEPDKGVVERSLLELSGRFPRDFRVKSLLGFIALERGDHIKAAALWKDAEGMAPVGFLQAWHITLQGRAAECAGKFTQAASFYDQAVWACPSWSMPSYRKIVCQVKTGFADSALGQVSSLLDIDANYFNMAIIDPEMERGQIQILTGLGTLWAVTEAQMRDEAFMLERLRKEINSWFTPDHSFAVQAVERIGRLLDLARYHNYVPYIAALHGRVGLERDMQQIISRESRDFRDRFRRYLEKLARIQDEAAWFPFPRIMVEFNRNYNLCAASLNWAMQSNLHTPEAFRRAQVMATEEEDRIAKLEKRLKMFRLIRDVTLFFLTLARTFFWLEVIGLLIVLVVIPLLLYYSQKTGSAEMLSVFAGQQWQVQKAATFAVSFLALTIAVLRSVLRFEKIRDALLEKARKADKRKQDARRQAALAERKKEKNL